MNRIAATTLIAIAFSVVAAACDAITPPPGFARLDSNDDYSWRATSAEGVVLGVRKENNDPKGNLDFWASAVRYELERKGYERIDTDPIRSLDGVDGRRLRYRTTRGGRPFVMWATVFVTDSRVVIVEAGGDEAHFTSVQKAVDQAIRSVEAG